MKVRRFIMVGVIGAICATSSAPATEQSGTENAVAQAANPAAAKPPAKPTRVELEKQFKESLTDAVLEGIWQMTGKGGLEGNEPLTEPKKERYTIASVTKTGDEHWIISARIEYADRDVTVPILVRVVWAGDTPMITIDDLAIPMIGAYSARVIFHKGFYSGVWYSNSRNYGGILSGRIVKLADKNERTSESSNEE